MTSGVPRDRIETIRAYLDLSTCNVSDALDRLTLDGAPRCILPPWPGCGRIAGDDNGVVVVPGEHIEDVLRIAKKCHDSEERVKRWIPEGVDTAQVHDRVRYEGKASRRTNPDGSS